MSTLRTASTLVLAAAITAACSDSKSSMNPTAPSAIVAGPQSDEAGASDAVSSATGGPKNNNGGGNGNGNGGNGNGNGNDNGKGNGNGNGNQPTVPTAPQLPTNSSPPPTNSSPITTRKVEIEGLIAAKAGDSITVNAQAVVVPPTCVIRHGNTTFSLADLHVGDRVHVKGSRITVGSGATATSTIEATEVKLQNPGGGEESESEPTALVSVSAFDALASETGSNTGTFRLSRTGSATQLLAPLTVNFTLTGTATNGLDYQNLPSSVSFPASTANVDVVVTPSVDGTTEGPESVILTLTSVAPYELGAPLTATMTITDTDTPLVSVAALDSTASETGPDAGSFRFSRTGSTAAPLTVTFTLTGSAANGTDYQSIPLTVTFGIGQATWDVAVFPQSDGEAEGSETVTATVTDDAAYDVGAPAAATITIAG